MALSDDIKQLIRREQDIQGVIGVLDTYLTDRQKRRDDYKPIKADKPEYVEYKTKDKYGNITTEYITKKEAASRGPVVTTEAKEEDAGDLYKYDLDGEVGYLREPKVDAFIEENPNANIGKNPVYKAPKVDKPKEIGDLNKVDLKQFQRYEAFIKEINKNLGTKLHPISGDPINIYKELISEKSKYAKDIIDSPQVKKIQANNALSKDEKEEKIFKWVLQNYVFKGRPQEYKDYINYEKKFRYMFEIEEEPDPNKSKTSGSTSPSGSTPPSGGTFDWVD